MPTVHFVVDGEGLTDIVRNIWSYDPPKALDILANIDGIDAKTARAILAGKMKLVGQSVCDDEKCSQCEGKTPMGVAKDDAKDSFVEAERVRAEQRERERKELEEIAQREEEEEERRQETSDVLSQYESTVERAEAVASWRARRNKAVKDRLGFDPTLPQMAMEITAVLPPELRAASKAMLDNLHAAPDESAPVPDDLTLTDGLLAPNGDWYSCNYGQHRTLADRIVAARGQELRPLTNLGTPDAESQLDDEGWMKVGQYLLASPDRLRVVMHKDTAPPVTEAQKETLKRWAEKFANEFRWNGIKTTYAGWLALLREPGGW